jgi:arylformamidase
MSIVDLSHPLITGQPGYPTDPILRISPHTTIASHGFHLSRIELGSHHGTHLDAMAHFLEGGKTIERMPLDWFIGPARLLRIPRQAHEEIAAADLRPFEPLLTPEAKILLATGWHRQFGTEAYFTDCPSLTIDAAHYLISRDIRLLGIDMPTPSRQWLEFHRLLLAKEHEVVLVESLANLDLLPDEFTFIGLPLKIAGCDGSPIRAVAMF